VSVEGRLVLAEPVGEALVAGSVDVIPGMRGMDTVDTSTGPLHRDWGLTGRMPQLNSSGQAIPALEKFDMHPSLTNSHKSLQGRSTPCGRHSGT